MAQRALLIVLVALAGGIMLLGGCAQEEQTGTRTESEPEVEVIAAFPIDGSQEPIDAERVEFDAENSSDGNGSFRITAEEPLTVTLFELGDVDVENAELAYHAMVRTEDVEGQVYLEMICGFGEEGEYFSRALDSQVYGSVDWTEQETPFYLQPGENPTNVKLNLVIYGSGTAWIDDISVVRLPLPEGQALGG